jgi:hypothetical protein
MPAGDIETYFEQGEWKNWDQEADADVGDPHSTREEAVAEGRELARQRNVEHVVRDQDATIVDREDHGEDHGDDEESQDELRAREREAFEARHGAPDPTVDQ